MLFAYSGNRTIILDPRNPSTKSHVKARATVEGKPLFLASELFMYLYLVEAKCVIPCKI